MVHLGIQAARALAEAHARGVIHRDVKPGNVFVSQPLPGEREQIRLLDFGVARIEDEEHSGLTHAGAVIGTPGFIAPEVAADPPPPPSRRRRDPRHYQIAVLTALLVYGVAALELEVDPFNAAAILATALFTQYLGGRLTGGDLGAVLDRVAERVEPGERGVLDDRFSEGSAHAASQSLRTGTANNAPPKLTVALPS